MKAIRWAAAAVTVLMSLMNIPVVFDREVDYVPTAVGWAVFVLGLVGLVAAAGLARRTSWGRPAVLAVGAANLVAAVVALVKDWDGAAVGLVVSILILGLGFFADRGAAVPSPAYGR